MSGAELFGWLAVVAALTVLGLMAGVWALAWAWGRLGLCDDINDVEVGE